MKNIIKSKKVLTIIGAVIILLIIVLGSYFLFFKGSKKQNEVLSSSLKNLGITFYEDFYYKQAGTTNEERQDFLKKYKDIGIKITLDSLARYNVEKTDSIYQEFVNKKTEEDCDRTNSMVIIYPKEPYGKTNYTIDAVLSCGFDVEETK